MTSQRRLATAVAAVTASLLLAGCGQDVAGGVARAEDGERGVRQAVVAVAVDLLRTAEVAIDDDTALRGGYRRCGDDEGSVQYVAEQVFVPAGPALDRLGPLADVLSATGWTTRGPQRDIVTAERAIAGEDVRLALSVVEPRLRVRVEAACIGVGEESVKRLLARPEGFVPP